MQDNEHPFEAIGKLCDGFYVEGDGWTDNLKPGGLKCCGLSFIQGRDFKDDRVRIDNCNIFGIWRLLYIPFGSAWCAKYQVEIQGQSAWRISGLHVRCAALHQELLTRFGGI